MKETLEQMKNNYLAFVLLEEKNSFNQVKNSNYSFQRNDMYSLSKVDKDVLVMYPYAEFENQIIEPGGKLKSLQQKLSDLQKELDITKALLNQPNVLATNKKELQTKQTNIQREIEIRDKNIKTEQGTRNDNVQKTEEAQQDKNLGYNLLYKTVQAAIAEKKPVIIPIAVGTTSFAHWITIAIVPKQNGGVQILSKNPITAKLQDQTGKLGCMSVYDIINKAITDVNEKGEFLDNLTETGKQTGNQDCGPITVNNIVFLAEQLANNSIQDFTKLAFPVVQDPMKLRNDLGMKYLAEAVKKEEMR